MAVVYKALSALLSYPSEALQDAAADVAAVLQDCDSLPKPVRNDLAALAQELAEQDILDLEARYVELFDRSRSLSLHLFEHVHGESRDRGQAMVTLRERYRDAGFDIAARELPDYLPLLLEFLSLRPETEAQALLGEAAHVLRILQERLTKRGSSYAAVFAVLEALGAQTPDAGQLAELRRAPLDDPADLAALDKVWAETEVVFGPSAQSCSQPVARSVKEVRP